MGSWERSSTSSAGEIELTSEVRLTVPLLEAILNQRLTALLREETGSDLFPFVAMSIQDEPLETGRCRCRSERGSGRSAADCRRPRSRPGRPGHEWSDRRRVGHRSEQTVRNYELIGNQFWLDVMTRYVLNPDLDPQDVADRIPDTMALTGSDVRRSGRHVAHPQRFIHVDLVPAWRWPAPSGPAGHLPLRGGKRLRQQLDVGFLHDGKERQVLAVDDSLEGDVADGRSHAPRSARSHAYRSPPRSWILLRPGHGPLGGRLGGSAGTVRPVAERPW